MGAYPRPNSARIWTHVRTISVDLKSSRISGAAKTRRTRPSGSDRRCEELSRSGHLAWRPQTISTSSSTVSTATSLRLCRLILLGQRHQPDLPNYRVSPGIQDGVGENLDNRQGSTGLAHSILDPARDRMMHVEAVRKRVRGAVHCLGTACETIAHAHCDIPGRGWGQPYGY